MYGSETVRRAHALAKAGLTQTDIARELGIGPTTVGRWLRLGREATLASPMRSRASSRCPERCPFVVAVPTREYAYLRGQYLGDGTIVHTRAGVYRLFVSCCAAYPRVVDECEQAIRPVLPHNRVGRRTKPGAIDVNAYSKHWPCLFPSTVQAGSTRGPSCSHPGNRLLFTTACDRLGVEWRRMNRHDISVARRDSFARLDSIVGPKT